MTNVWKWKQLISSNRGVPRLPYLSAGRQGPSSPTPNRCTWRHQDTEARGWQEAGAPLGLLLSCPSTSEQPAGGSHMHWVEEEPQVFLKESWG